MGTATARVPSAWYPPWMAMVSSCISFVAPLAAASQPICVQNLGGLEPRPGRSGAHLCEWVRLHQGRIAALLGDRSMQCLELGPVLWGNAVQRQTWGLVTLASDEPPDVALILAQQAGGLILGMTLHEDHLRSGDVPGGHTPSDCLRLNGDVISGALECVLRHRVRAGMGQDDGPFKPGTEGVRRVD